MWNIIKEYRHYVITLILAIIPLVALNAGGKRAADLHFLDKVAVQISGPVQSAISWTIDASWGAVENYLLLLHTRQANEEMTVENRKLYNELEALQEVSLENKRLKKQIEFNSPLAGRKVIARVIAQDVSPEFRMIRIDKGTLMGVEKGMAVVTPEGIVGRILRVSKDYADILTLTDSSSAIDAIIQRNRSRGVIEGLSETMLTMKYLRRTDDIQVGDEVISSGIGGVFPKGLPIGKVANVKKQNYGITQVVEVNPAVDFSRLEEVTVIDPPKLPLEEEPVQ
jgi:rod shape-determining protein MreC